MKLSMWILADWFSGLNVRCNISDGAASIAGVRFFSEELNEFAPGNLYMGRAGEVFSGEEYKNAVLLVHGYDLMFIEDQSLEAVLNRVLAAFDHYNGWESSLWAALAGNDAVRRMVALSEAVLKAPIAVADSAGRVLAFTAGDGPHRRDEGWQYIFETGRVPQTYTSSRIEDADGNVLTDWSTAPQIYRMDGRTCVSAQIEADGEYVAAFYMQQFDRKLTRADVQLAEVFCGVLTAAASMINGDTGVKSSAAVIAGILDGGEVTPQAAVKLKEAVPAPPPYKVIAIRSAVSNVNIVRKNTLLGIIGGIRADCVALEYGNDILCVTESARADYLVEALLRHISGGHYAIGLSLPFSRWEDLAPSHRQALFAISHGGGQPGIYNWEDYAFDHILSCVGGANRELGLIHPALGTLSDYDRKHGTQLYETLERYLSSERNMVETAAALCLHRNSMKYRIRRIKELIGADLDDPRERVYILLSYHLARL